MREQSANPTRIIIELAERQHGVVAWRQLLALGIGRRAIEERVRSGLLRRIHRGVYSVGRTRLDARGHYMAATLALCAGTALSHHSAAAHHGLRASLSGRVAVTAPNASGRRQRDGITIHFCAVEPWEREDVDGIPTTTVARTLLDLAEQFPARVVEKGLTRAEQLRVLDLAAIGTVMAAHPGRIGAKRLRRIVTQHPAARAVADDGIEELFLAIVDSNNLRRPEVKPDVYVPGRAVPYQPDFLWRPPRLIVETDGTVHHTASAFEGDRAKSNALTLAGYVVLRFTYRQVTGQPSRIADQLRAAGVPPG
jgi:hypothetical protein